MEQQSERKTDGDDEDLMRPQTDSQTNNAQPQNNAQLQKVPVVYSQFTRVRPWTNGQGNGH